MFVLEGLANKGIKRLWEKLPRPQEEGMIFSCIAPSLPSLKCYDMVLTVFHILFPPLAYIMVPVFKSSSLPSLKSYSMVLILISSFLPSLKSCNMILIFISSSLPSLKSYNIILIYISSPPPFLSLRIWF